MTVERSGRALRWVAALRIVLGAWFLKSVVTKWSWEGALPEVSERWIGFLPVRLAEYAEGNPLPFYRTFLQEVAIPRAELFAHLTAVGEAVAGFGLVLGLATRLSAGVALFLVLAYGLANFWVGPPQQGFHLLLLTGLAAAIHVDAGRIWGLDGLRDRRTRANQ